MTRLILALLAALAFATAAFADESCPEAPEVGLWRGRDIPDIALIIVRQVKPCEDRRFEVELWGPCGRSVSCYHGRRTFVTSGFYNPNGVARFFQPTDDFRPRAGVTITGMIYLDRSGAHAAQDVLMMKSLISVERQVRRWRKETDHVSRNGAFFRVRPDLDLSSFQDQRTGLSVADAPQVGAVALEARTCGADCAPRICASLCARATACAAWSYRAPTYAEPRRKRCDLYGAPGRMIDDPSAVSGVLTER